MFTNQLFEMALHITEPYYIADLSFDPKERKLDIEIDFRKGAKFTIIGDQGEKVQGTAYDTIKKTWRHLNFFEHECYLHARVPRVKYDGGIKQVKMPWEGLANGFTLLLEAIIVMMAMSMPVRKISMLMKVSEKKMWRILDKYVREGLGIEDYSEVKVIGIDETSQAKRHNYITLFVDLLRKKTLFIADGKDADTIDEFISMLCKQKGKPEKIEEVSCDMSPAFIKGVNEHLPNAKITFDRFHCMKIINEAVDAVRKEERKNDPNLKGLRYVFLKNENHLTKKQRSLLETLKLSDCGKKTLKAYHLKELYRLGYESQTEEAFEEYLKKWYYSATHSQLEPIIKAAKTIKEHWDGVVRWRKSQISNAILEGFNSLIQAAKARARGYATSKNFKIIAFLLTGKLNFNQLNPHWLPT